MGFLRTTLPFPAFLLRSPACFAVAAVFLARIILPHSAAADDSPRMLLEESSVVPAAMAAMFADRSLLCPEEGVRLVRHRVAEGENLVSLWKKYGASVSAAFQAMAALRGIGLKNLVLYAGEQIQMELSAGNEIMSLERTMKDGSLLKLFRLPASGYSASMVEPRYEEATVKTSGVITSSFLAAAKSRRIPPRVINAFVDLFANRVAFHRDLQPGDTFTVEYQEKRRIGQQGVVHAGPILTASLRRGSKLYAAVRYAAPGEKPHYFDENGDALGSFFLRYPVKFSRISSIFSWGRYHPILQRKRPHLGIDLAAAVGTPVRAVGEGVVSRLGYGPGPGNFIELKHGGRWSTAYLHLSRFAFGLRRGSPVKRGQVIGYVGSTGVSTGPHLHYALFDRGKYVDPMRTDLPVSGAAKSPIPTKLLQAQLSDIRREHDRLRG